MVSSVVHRIPCILFTEEEHSAQLKGQNLLLIHVHSVSTEMGWEKEKDKGGNKQTGASIRSIRTRKLYS